MQSDLSISFCKAKRTNLYNHHQSETQGEKVFISAETLDDLLHEVIAKLLASSNHIGSSRGPNTEIHGVLLELRNPLARLSRTEMKGTLFSCLGEFLWYMTGRDDLDFIEHYLSGYGQYSDDQKTIHGAYGPRLLSMNGEINQVKNIINLLREKPSSRKAVIQLFSASDLLRNYKDIPCTCTLQFMVRDSRLHMFTTMRSNDAFIGMPHDIFAFTMLQELIARALNIELGSYKHAAGSLHLYYKDRDSAEKFIAEGWQSTVLMPAMPRVDPWGSLGPVAGYEERIRGGEVLDFRKVDLNSYWIDIVRILQIYSLSKGCGNSNKIGALKRRIRSPEYIMYIEKKELTMTKQATAKLAVTEDMFKGMEP